jgi:hypothetical protein
MLKIGKIAQVALQVQLEPSKLSWAFLKERIAQVALQVRLELSKVSWAIL